GPFRTRVATSEVTHLAVWFPYTNAGITLKVSKLKVRKITDAVPAFPWGKLFSNDDLDISGTGFVMGKLDNKAKAFSNIRYSFENVPPNLAGSQATILNIGETAGVIVKARKDTTLYAATDPTQTPQIDLTGWTATG